MTRVVSAGSVYFTTAPAASGRKRSGGAEPEPLSIGGCILSAIQRIDHGGDAAVVASGVRLPVRRRRVARDVELTSSPQIYEALIFLHSEHAVYFGQVKS